MSIIDELKRRNVFRVAAVYVALAWLVIQVAETLFPVFNFGAQALRTVVVVAAIGFLPTVAAAWLLELTPDGVKLDDGDGEHSEFSRRTSDKLNRIIIVLLLLAVTYFSVDKFFFAGSIDSNLALSGDRTLAVIPFDNFSPEPDQDYLVDGLSEEVLNALSRLPGLRVTARTSSFYFQQRSISIQDIAEELDVEFIVDGSVRREANRLRVTYQLVRARDGFEIWAESLDRSIQDVLDVQIDVATSIARSMNVLLDDDDRASLLGLGTRSVDAYLHFLRGRELLYEWSNEGREESVSAAEDWLRKSIQEDPTFGAAYTLRSSIYYHKLDAFPVESDANSQILQYLLSDISNAIRHSRDSGARLVNEFRYALFAREFDSLLRLSRQLDPEELANAPGAEDIDRINRVLLLLGHTDKVRTYSKRWIKRDPLASKGYFYAWGAAMVDRDTKAAYDYLQQGISRTGNSVFFEHNLTMTLLLQNEFGEAQQHLKEPNWGQPAYRQSMLALALALNGEDVSAQELINTLIASETNNVFLALAQVELGNVGSGREMLQAIDSGPGGTMHFIHTIVEFGGRMPFPLDWVPQFEADTGALGVTFDEAGYLQD